MNLPELHFAAISPELIVIVTVLLVMAVELLRSFRPHAGAPDSHLYAWISMLGLVIAAVLTVITIGQPAIPFQGMVLTDDLSRYLDLVVLLSAVFGVLLAWDYLPRFSNMQSEFYSLLLLAVAGMMFMGKAVDLITLFISLEILSLALYVLTGFHRRQLVAGEAALKYFLLGAFSSGFFLYGAALLYAATGSTSFSDIAALAPGGFFTLVGLALLLVGFGFKLAVVPFHMWAPDAYQGAPTPITAFMSVGTKAAAFVALFRLLGASISVPHVQWGMALAVLALLTMTWGNLAALRQRSLKRMLAYSSIAHAGYMLTGVVAGSVAGLNAVIFYLFTYVFMNIGAFAIVSLLERGGPDDAQDAELITANGLFVRSPALASAMAIFMLSLAGMPPLAGFFGKLYVFSAVVQSGWTWLAVAGVLNSVISAYYYLRVTVAMFMNEPGAETPLLKRLPASALVVVTLAAAGTVLFGIFASPWFQTLGQAAVAALATP